MRQKNNSQLNVCKSLADSYISPHTQPAKLSLAHCEVPEGVGCSGQQSWATRDDSRDVFVKSDTSKHHQKVNNLRQNPQFDTFEGWYVLKRLHHVRRGGFQQN